MLIRTYFLAFICGTHAQSLSSPGSYILCIHSFIILKNVKELQEMLILCILEEAANY
jgi:hypothetical protein